MNHRDTEAQSGEVQHRRVVIDLTVRGTAEQANAVRDAVGLAANDEWLRGIITPLLQSEEISSVDWKVSGERWMPGPETKTE